MKIKTRLMMNLKKIAISVNNPRVDVTKEEIVNVMYLILTKNIFMPNGEALVSSVDPKIIQTDATKYDLAL